MKARFQLSAAATLIVVLALSFAQVSVAQTSSTKPNVLFIAIDDLNDWVGYLGGNAQSPTPNLDRLASAACASPTRTRRSRCATPRVPRCCPACGRRPPASTTTTSIGGRSFPSRKMITAQFRKAGYWVAGAGKMHHGPFLRESDWDEYVKSKDGFQREPGDPMHSPNLNDVPDDAMLDYRNVTWLIEQLQKKRDQPFFLAAGLHKPHMPWNVPRKYYDLFPLERSSCRPTCPPTSTTSRQPACRWRVHAGG